MHKRKPKTLLDKIVNIISITIITIAIIKYFQLVHTADERLLQGTDSKTYEQQKQEYVMTLKNN